MIHNNVANIFFSLVAIAMCVQCSNSNSEKLKEIENKESDYVPVSNKISEKVMSLPKEIKFPKDNPSDSTKIALGKLLFYDPILSGDKDVSCATCHHPNNGYAEYRDLSIGVNGNGLSSKRIFNTPNTIPIMKRNSQTILNTAFNGINTSNLYEPENAPMFWDSRVSSLEKQAIEPILAFEEMRGTHFSEAQIVAVIIKRLKAIPEYVTLFDEAFNESESITEENIGKSIASFERTLIATNSRFDRYKRGDTKAMSLSEKEGFRLFQSVGCIECHNGPMFSDFKSHVLGVPQNKKLSQFDKGIDSIYAFRTPSLRNLQLTAPYMHNGTFNTLKQVLEFYEDLSSGKNFHVELTEKDIDTLARQQTIKVRDMDPIISFLNALNDSGFDKEIPKTVPSKLPVGGNIKN